ncbi:MAG: hypothetical protein JNJ91_10545 [Flavobacteriales bacterium]|nr:hypothetical protein [Flavobacteriales bacterium]
MVVPLTMALIVVVTFAAPFRPALALVRKEELFRFKLKLLDLFAYLGEALLRFLVSERCHGGRVLCAVRERTKGEQAAYSGELRKYIGMGG